MASCRTPARAAIRTRGSCTRGAARRRSPRREATDAQRDEGCRLTDDRAQAEGEARDELATVPDGLLAQYHTERERDGEMNARVLPQGLARDRPDACPEEVEQHEHERPPWSDEPTYARPQHQRGKDFDERADDVSHANEKTEVEGIE